MKDCPDCGHPLEIIPSMGADEVIHSVCRACGMGFNTCSECGHVIRRVQFQPGDRLDGEWGY